MPTANDITTMHIRIFATEETGLAKYFNLLRGDYRNAKNWVVEHVDAVKWQPTEPATVHIYVDHVVRTATPWAAFNILIAPEMPTWISKEGEDGKSDRSGSEVDLLVTPDRLAERSKIVRTCRFMLEKAVRDLHDVRLAVPPETNGTPPPKVAIITCTANRAGWWPNMIQNVLKQSWPVSRLEWVIVDNGEDENLIQNEVQEFIEKMPLHTIKYKLAPGFVSIGELRNIAVREASPDVEYFVVMDDDDYYPPDSVKTRVSWLRRQETQIAYCSTIPMYDTTRYISAMNVPPLSDPPSQRISEATLAFTRAAWEERQFPDYFMAEGEEFLEGRESKSVDIPCASVIVSFIHGSNSSSRRVPAEQDPNGCHYGFPDQYFRYLHEMTNKEKEKNTSAA